MTDNKLTYDEIIKLLELFVKRSNRNYDTDIVLDLINRQKAEIEELKEKLTLDFEKIESEYDGKIKSEAYKEFAERLKEHINNCHSVSDEGEYVCYDCACANVTNCIDNLVKEMVVEEE